MGKGIQGDRYFSDANRKAPDYEITFIESEEIDRYNATHPDSIEYRQPRRNVLTAGIALNELVGAKFRVGGARFEGLETCEPCELLRTRTSPAAFRWFVGKGGLRARILDSGRIKVGDRFEVETG